MIGNISENAFLRLVRDSYYIYTFHFKNIGHWGIQTQNKTMQNIKFINFLLEYIDFSIYCKNKLTS